METYHTVITEDVISKLAIMDVAGLEKIIPNNVCLISSLAQGNRESFFSLLRVRFKAAQEDGVRKYKVSKSFCDNCYDGKQVTVFTEKENNGFAIAFDTDGELISTIRICSYYGIPKENLEEESHCRCSYF